VNKIDANIELVSPSNQLASSELSNSQSRLTILPDNDIGKTNFDIIFNTKNKLNIKN